MYCSYPDLPCPLSSILSVSFPTFSVSFLIISVSFSFLSVSCPFLSVSFPVLCLLFFPLSLFPFLSASFLPLCLLSYSLCLISHPFCLLSLSLCLLSHPSCPYPILYASFHIPSIFFLFHFSYSSPLLYNSLSPYIPFSNLLRVPFWYLSSRTSILPIHSPHIPTIPFPIFHLPASTRPP